MRTSGLGGYSAYGMGMDFNSLRRSESGDAGDKVEASKDKDKTQATTKPGASSGSLAQELAGLFDKMNLSSNSQVAFATLQQFRKKMESEFSEKVRNDLKELGVDPEVDFRLVTDDKGGVKVISDHPDKEKIEKYFADNPDMVTKFNDIQALSKLDQARKEQQLSPAQIRTRIQMQSIAIWFDTAGSGGGASIMDFASNGANFLSGLRRTV